MGREDGRAPTFGQRLRQLRVTQGHTLLSLSELTNYSTSYLSELERDKKRASSDSAGRLDDALDAGGTLAALRVSSSTESDAHKTARLLNEDALIIMTTADESARQGRQAGHSNVSDAQLAQWEVELDHIAVDLLTEPVLPLVQQSRSIRDDAFAILEGRQYPRQAERLYAIATRACGLLAGVAADRFALYDAAMKHVRTASVAADLARAPELGAWVASVESAVAFWQGRYRTAAVVAARARESSPIGAEAARLASLEARAWAKMGDRDAMDQALNAASHARDADGPVAGVGIMAFPRSNQLRIAGTAQLWIGDNDRARTQLEDAVTLLAEEYDSMVHMAAARADLALADLRAGRLDAAEAVLQPLISLRDTQPYLANAARRTDDLLAALRGARYATSRVAGQLVADIEAFVAAQAVNGEVEATGVGTDRELPR